MNLVKILKGHIDEIFYSPLLGEIILIDIEENNNYPLKFALSTCSAIQNIHRFTSDGKYFNGIGECQIFPSKVNRDWDLWEKEQYPKSYSDFNTYKDKLAPADYYNLVKRFNKHANYYYKILITIHCFYGGIPKLGEPAVTIEYDFKLNKYVTKPILNSKYSNLILFKTIEYAEKFLNHPKNCKLLNNYFSLI